MQWITEENYEKTMAEVVEPYLAERGEQGFVERVKGEPIYYEHYRADQPKGIIVISHGFTESIRKYYESIYYMLQAGYSVWGMDHRGHGRSYRENKNPFVVHVSHFEDYLLDFRYLMDTLVRPDAKGLPIYLYGHYMGGCIGALMLEEHPFLFRKAVLSSPMFGLSFGKIPLPFIYAAAGVKGLGERKMEPMKPVAAFLPDDFENSCDSSRCRYDYYKKKRLEDPLLQTTEASIGWGRAAIKACFVVNSGRRIAHIHAPILLFQAGDETVVKPDTQKQFAKRVPGCRFESIPGKKHELYMTDSDTLIPYWEKIFAFYEE